MTPQDFFVAYKAASFGWLRFNGVEIEFGK